MRFPVSVWILASFSLACASPVHVSSAACDLSGEIRTGTVVECSQDGVRVSRESVSTTVRASGGMLGGALRVLGIADDAHRWTP